MSSISRTSPSDNAVVKDLIQRIRSASSTMADACAYVGSAMRGTFVQLQVAVAQNDMPRIATLVESIRENELISTISGKFHHLRERATDLWDALRPWAKTIFGVVVGLVGYFLAAELGMILAAILMVGGFLYAIVNGMDAATRRAEQLF